MEQTKFVRIVLRLPIGMLEELNRRAEAGGWDLQFTLDMPTETPPSANGSTAAAGAR